MNGFNHAGTCFVADGSWPGSETLTKTCKEKYMIKYDDPHNHSVINDLAYDFSMQIVNGNLVVKMYRVLNGQKTLIDTAKEVLTDKAYEKVCNLTDPTFVVSTACQATIGLTIDKLKYYLVTEHNWTHDTYEEIIRHPFYNHYLSPSDLMSRVAPTSKSPFKADIYKEADGVIYTERNQPRKIKYLKVIDPKKSQYYTLYGNSQANEFECKNNDKDCIMIGGGNADLFVTDEYSNDYIIRDFKKNKDFDKIIIKGNKSNSGLRSVEYEMMNNGIIKLIATCGECVATDRQEKIIYKNIYLEDVNFNDVDNWVKDAKSTNLQDREESPIKIK